MPALRFVNVSKHYAVADRFVPALHDISLEIEYGEFVALVGRSGCGKSTLLNLAGAMDLPSSGQVHIGDMPTSGMDDRELTAVRRAQVGFVFQFFQLLPTLAAVENVELSLLLAARSDARQRALAALDLVGLAGLADRLPHQLSGGQMQRVAIARALVHGPKLLLADEPLGNLDSETAEGILELMQRVNRDLGTSIVMATHSMTSTARAERVLRLTDGRVEHDDAANR